MAALSTFLRRRISLSDVCMSKINPDWSPPPAPEGWVLQDFRETFGYLAGPCYFRTDPKTPGVGFYSEPHHSNLGGVIHGGMLLTLADMSLFDICYRSIGRFRGVTVTLNSEFVGAGPIGEFIEAYGELVKAGRRMMFCRGLVTAKGETIMSFSGTLKRLD